MKDSGKKLFSLMFDPGDTMCVSDSKFGYHSVSLDEALSEKVPLNSPNPKMTYREVSSDKLTLVALNAINGFRSDENCYKYRSFLVELDPPKKPDKSGYTEEEIAKEIKLQINTIKHSGMPYSACVFSGNKSLHWAIVLEELLPDERIYRKFGKWILNILTTADQSCQNPSRMIRIPGAIRPETGKKQTLVEFKGLVSFNGRIKAKDLIMWLRKYPNSEPKEREKKSGASGEVGKISPWLARQLKSKKINFSNGRSNTWFAIACDFAIAGHSEEDAFAYLSNFFTPDHDFKEKEWETVIKSGYKKFG